MTFFARSPPPPPTPKKALGNAKASMFRRLGSAFFSAPSADAADAALASDLEKAASNSVKQSFKQVRSLAKQSFLQVRVPFFSNGLLQLVLDAYLR